MLRDGESMGTTEEHATDNAQLDMDEQPDQPDQADPADQAGDGEAGLSEEEIQARELHAKRLRVLERDGMQLDRVPEEERTREFCTLALKQNGLALQYVPEAARDMYLCQKAVRSNGLALQFVPMHLRSASVCRLALRRNGLALQYVPDETRDRSVCLTALEQNSRSLQYVPDALRDEDLCRTALRVDGAALEFVPEGLRSRAMCFEACRTNGLALNFVPAEHLDLLLRVRALFSAMADVRRRTTILCQTPPDWEELRKNKPRDEWGRFEKWVVEKPGDFPYPEAFALQPGEVGDLLIQLARDFEQAAGRPDFAELVQAQDADKSQPDQPNKQAKDPKLVCGRSFWLEVTVEDRGKKSIYAPALALLHRLELDEHGVPVKTGAFTAAAELLDWAADWWENTQAPEPAKS